ncbi:MAG: sensor histidine kinase [Thermoleophilia bacterium]|nr:sensor histidine kinase [Thermoleophilia bacterium]
MATSVSLDPAAVRRGRVRGRYFRENFAQAGIDLAQIVPELVTNADDAITASGRERGRIQLRFGPPDPELRLAWRRELRRLRAPALLDWAHEVSCADDGIGMDADLVDRRLGALGAAPEGAGQRGLFGRGLRDVWLAQGGGRLQSVHAGRAVESWFFPVAGDEPYAFVHVLDCPASAGIRRDFGIEGDGTRVTVPLALRRLPPGGRLRTLVSQLVQLRPVLDDPRRDLWLELAGEPPQLVVFPGPEPDPERPLLFDGEVEVRPGVTARVVVRRAAEPIPLGPSRATRRGGLVVRSGRAAHETTLAGLEGHPGARHLYGEVWCEAIERLQREALDSPRPQVVVRVDRSGLNESHPFVQRLHVALERVLRPIVVAEERRAGAHRVAPGRAIRARDAVGLRALNDALRAAFDAPGSAGFRGGGAPSARAPLDEAERAGSPSPPPPPPDAPVTAALDVPMRFKRSPVRLRPGERRTVTILFDPARVPAGAPIAVAVDAGLSLALRRQLVPAPGARGWASVSGTLKASVAVEPGSRLAVLAEAGEHAAELEVLVVRHTASGWVREIARKDEDAQIEAQFDPESGVVTVFEGRREFRALERAARRAGLPRQRVREYLPYRMLEVEVAANAVYAWAAERILERRLAEERPADPAEYAGAVRLEAQSLRHRFHERLMRAFLDPEVFEGGVSLGRSAPVARSAQQSLLGDAGRAGSP